MLRAWESSCRTPTSTSLPAPRNSSSTAAPAHAPDDLRRIYSEWAKADDRIAWVVIDHRDQAVVGEVVLNHLDSGRRWCSFRIWLSRREQGLGSEATLLALGHAFDGAGLNRVELEVFDFNHRARAVYEKAGFTLEGIRRQALLFDGNWIDSLVMSILRSEWLVNTGSE